MKTKIINYSKEWNSNIRSDLLAGITVGLALIPESIAFSIIAGVDPMVGLYASILITIVIALVGGRPGMISAATGAMSLLMITLVKEHGLEYLLAATILTGIIQLAFYFFRIDRFMTFIPHSVVIGFVNALAILIFLAQLSHFYGASWEMYAMVGGTILIIYFMPFVTKAIPSPLIAITIMTIIAMIFHPDVKLVSDMGTIKQTLPIFHIPNIPLSLETLKIIFPYSLTLAIVGTLESLMMATIVDDMTNTPSNKRREVKGQGIANVVAGCFGGMAGCALIGQTVINVKSGGRGRLSTLVAGLFLLFLILVLGDIVKQIPMAALIGVMITVAIGTFDWHSVRNLFKIPRSDASVMVITVAIVVITRDLSQGVFAGVIMSALIFGWKISKLHVTTKQEQNKKVYYVSGQLFFGSMTHFINLFDYQQDPEEVVIDFTNAHVWDQSAVQAIAKAKEKYEHLNKKITIIGLNQDSKQLLQRIGLHTSSDR